VAAGKNRLHLDLVTDDLAALVAPRRPVRRVSMGGTLTTPERFTVLTGGPSSDERDVRLAEGADRLANGRKTLLGNERFLLALAAALMTSGVSLILLGWLGAAHSTLVEEQIPYLVSGGLVGVALALIGAMCLLSHWFTVLIREQRTREVARHQDHAELMAALEALSLASARQEDNTNGSARSARAERPIRAAPRRT
jgi:hypothetical protein